jgi:hypothetical protein
VARRVLLVRFLTLLLIWTAALALPIVAAPAAHAMAATAPCPMEASGVVVDHDAMGCCDHGKGNPQKAPCKPGMACFGTAAALPVVSAEAPVVAFDRVDLQIVPVRVLPSRPPDRTLRPPITL